MSNPTSRKSEESKVRRRKLKRLVTTRDSSAEAEVEDSEWGMGDVGPNQEEFDEPSSIIETTTPSVVTTVVTGSNQSVRSSSSDSTQTQQRSRVSSDELPDRSPELTDQTITSEPVDAMDDIDWEESFEESSPATGLQTETQKLNIPESNVPMSTGKSNGSDNDSDKDESSDTDEHDQQALQVFARHVLVLDEISESESEEEELEEPLSTANTKMPISPQQPKPPMLHTASPQRESVPVGLDHHSPPPPTPQKLVESQGGFDLEADLSDDESDMESNIVTSNHQTPLATRQYDALDDLNDEAVGPTTQSMAEFLKLPSPIEAKTTASEPRLDVVHLSDSDMEDWQLDSEEPQYEQSDMLCEDLVVDLSPGMLRI